MGVSINFVADSIEVAAADEDEVFSVLLFQDVESRRNSFALSLKDKGLCEAIKKAVDDYKAKQNVVPNVPVLLVGGIF
jgi:hypothetical protein